MTVSVQTIKDEINEVYSEKFGLKVGGKPAKQIEPELLKTSSAAAEFLANGKDDIDKMLAAFEKEIAESLEARYEPVVKYYKDLADYHAKTKMEKKPSKWAAKKPDKSAIDKGFSVKHTVSSALLSKLFAASSGEYKNQPVFVSFIYTPTFNDNLASGEHWKDPGVDPTHGEYTHQLQWVFIVGHKDKLGVKPEQLFSEVGKVTITAGQLPSNYKIGPKELGYWEILFDRGAAPFPGELNTSGIHDFRDPAKLLKYVISGTDRWPLIASYLLARQNKRSREFAFARESLFGDDSAAKKAFDNLLISSKPSDPKADPDYFAMYYLLKKAGFGTSRDWNSIDEKDLVDPMNTAFGGVRRRDV